MPALTEIRTAALEAQRELLPQIALLDIKEIKQRLLTERQIIPIVYQSIDVDGVTPLQLLNRAIEAAPAQRRDFAFALFLQRAVHEMDEHNTDEIYVPTALDYAYVATSILLSKEGIFPFSAEASVVDPVINEMHYIYSEPETAVYDFYTDNILAPMTDDLYEALRSGLMFSAIYNNLPIQSMQNTIKNRPKYALLQFRQYAYALQNILTA